MAELLVALVGLGILRSRLFWRCPDDNTVIDEANQLSEFPLEADCPTHHQPITFNINQVVVAFVLTDHAVSALIDDR